MVWKEDANAYVEITSTHEEDPDDILLECGHCGEMLNLFATNTYLGLDNVKKTGGE